MSASKFVVPSTRRIPNIVSRLLSRNHTNGKVSGKKFQAAKEAITSSKCKEYKDKLVQCPKPSYAFLCCKTLFPKPAPKCKAEAVVESYEKICKNLANRADSMLKEVRNGLKSVLDELNEAVEIAKNTEKAYLQEFRQGIEKKLAELSILDPSFVSLQRKSAMFLNYKASQDFQRLQCDIVPKIARVKEMLNQLERDLQICIDSAESLMSSCRKCENHQTLAKFSQENGDYARDILDVAFENARVRLKKIETYARDILAYQNSMAVEVTKTHREKNKAFLEHLDKCIHAAKNMD